MEISESELAPEPNATVLKEGWLLKCGDSGFLWNKRYFRLTSDLLMWYDDENCDQSRGQLDLREVGSGNQQLIYAPAVIVSAPNQESWLRFGPGSATQLEIELKCGRIIYLDCTDDARGAKEWFEILYAVILEIRTRMNREKALHAVLSAKDGLIISHFATFVQKLDCQYEKMPLVMYCIDWQRCERYRKEEGKAGARGREERRATLTAQLVETHLQGGSPLEGVLARDRILCEAWAEKDTAKIYHRATTLLADIMPTFVRSPEYVEFRSKCVESRLVEACA